MAAIQAGWNSNSQPWTTWMPDANVLDWHT